jgi:DNA-binding MarR family transcriptional regulator
MTVPATPLDPIKEAQRHWVDHGWEKAAEGMAMVTAVMRVQQILMQRVDAVLRPLDLTFARYEILMLLSFSRTGAMPMKAVGSRLQVHPTSVTSAVDRLEAQGYVQRRSHPTDRRAVLASITDAGRSIAAEATVVMNREVFEHPGLDRDDVEQLTRLLRLIRVHAGDT